MKNDWKKNLILYFEQKIEAERFLFENIKILNEIKFCIGQYDVQYFHGIPMVSFDDIPCISNYKILVGGSFENYEISKKNLSERGLKEFENFIWAKTYEKKLVCINANCHGTALINYLMLSNNFRKNYIIYPISNIHVNEEKRIDDALLKNADVFIHQDIRPDNSIAYELSDEYCQKFLSSDCKDIVIPNLVGFGNWLYPNLGEIIPYEKYNLFFRDKILDQAYRDICEDRLELFLDYFNHFVYSDAFLIDLYEKIMCKIELRENNWDVKVKGFIEDNFREIPMFVDAGHPSKYLMIEIGRQVLELLDIENDIDGMDLNMYTSDLGIPAPISGSIKRLWKINYKKDLEPRKSNLFTSGRRFDEDIYLKQYIMEYVWLLYGIKLKDKC